MRLEDIEIDLIDIMPDRRVVDMNWVEILSSDMAKNGQMQRIEVVAIGDRYRLISGAHRIGAIRMLGLIEIAAIVRERSDFASESDMKLREIAENFMRRSLSVLDRARDVAAWRKIYETTRGAVTPGRKKNRVKSDPISEIELDTECEAFAASFTTAAQTALRINKEAIKRALRIASIDEVVQRRIATYGRVADNQSELLALAQETPERQAAIVNILLSDPPLADSVSGAIAILDRIPVPIKAEPWARLSDKFSKLPQPSQRRFFQEHWDLIELMIAEGAASQ